MNGVISVLICEISTHRSLVRSLRNRRNLEKAIYTIKLGTVLIAGLQSEVQKLGRKCAGKTNAIKNAIYKT